MIDRGTHGPSPISRARPGATTLAQVAEAAGVSRSTASRAINSEARVSAQAQARVDLAVARLGYTPNQAARTLVTGRTDSIALIVPEPDGRVLTDPFFAATLSGLRTALFNTDLQLVLMIARPGEPASRSVRYLRSGHVDGAIVVSHHRDDALDQALVDSRLPNVFIGRPAILGSLVQYVDSDNVEGGRIATEHLVARGHRRVGTIAGPADMSAGVDRLAGWRKALATHGLPDDAVEQGDFTSAGGAAATERLLGAHPGLDAIFVASDLMAVGALAVLATRGIHVPHDVAVVGYDNLGVATSTTPALSTISNPVVAMASSAGGLLLEQLAGGPIGGPPVILAPGLVVRASS